MNLFQGKVERFYNLNQLVCGNFFYRFIDLC